MSQKYPLYFFHGLESGPHGRKYHRLAEDFEVNSPDFQKMDIWERLEKAEKETRGLENIIVVGSSFGGLLAALLYDRHPERFLGYVLMAPALHREEVRKEVEAMPPNAVVIHGRQDNVVPIEPVRDFCADRGVTITEVDDGHRLQNSLELMVAAVKEMMDSSD